MESGSVWPHPYLPLLYLTLPSRDARGRPTSAPTIRNYDIADLPPDDANGISRWIQFGMNTSVELDLKRKRFQIGYWWKNSDDNSAKIQLVPELSWSRASCWPVVWIQNIVIIRGFFSTVTSGILVLHQFLAAENRYH